jgi:LmbE family N-acetylglucosaminyl deacetylase
MQGKTPFQQRFTQKSETYGVTAPDYQSLTHGKPAPYLRGSVVDDLAEIIRERQPGEIYLTNEADKHFDHRIAFSYVCDAIHLVNYPGDLFTYIVHGKPPATPPDRRVILSAQQNDIKRRAIEDHQADTSPIHDYLADEYMRTEELFWKVRVEPAASK